MNAASLLKIFIVDDDLFSLSVYSTVLTYEGYKNLEKYLDCSDCLSNLHKKPDVIFLDYNLQDYTGLEVLIKIKRYNPDIFVVMCSGQDDINKAVESLKYGAFDYLVKDGSEGEKMKEVLKRIISVKSLMYQNKSNFLKRIFSMLF